MTLEEIKNAIRFFDVKEETHVHDFHVVISVNNDIRIVGNYDELFDDDNLDIFDDFENCKLGTSCLVPRFENGSLIGFCCFVNLELTRDIDDYVVPKDSSYDFNLDFEDYYFLKKLVCSEFNNSIFNGRDRYLESLRELNYKLIVLADCCE